MWLYCVRVSALLLSAAHLLLSWNDFFFSCSRANSISSVNTKNIYFSSSVVDFFSLYFFFFLLKEYWFEGGLVTPGDQIVFLHSRYRKEMYSVKKTVHHSAHLKYSVKTQDLRYSTATLIYHNQILNFLRNEHSNSCFLNASFTTDSVFCQVNAVVCFSFTQCDTESRSVCF